MPGRNQILVFRYGYVLLQRLTLIQNMYVSLVYTSRHKFHRLSIKAPFSMDFEQVIQSCLCS